MKAPGFAHEPITPGAPSDDVSTAEATPVHAEEQQPQSTTILDGSAAFAAARRAPLREVAALLGCLDGGRIRCPNCDATSTAVERNVLTCGTCQRKADPIAFLRRVRKLGDDAASVTTLVAAFGAEEPAVIGKVQTPASVVATWREEGPLVHEPTGIAKLDEVTGGGPVYGSRWYLVGAPDAGKTALAVQLADVFARRGILVGILAADEEPTDIVMRLAQRARWSRSQCERRAPDDIDSIADALADLPVRLYDGATTIEAAAEDLAAEALRLGVRALLVVDSVQTVLSTSEGEATSVREAVTARVRAIRTAASRYSMLVVSTSEMGRHAYRTIEAAETVDDLASAKESGAIEYSARVMLALRSVRGESDLIRVKVAKNKHGPAGDEIFLALDRRTMTVSECEAPAAEADGAAESARSRARTTTDAARVASAMAASPGMTGRELAAAVRAEHGATSRDRIDAAVSALGAAVVLVPGTRRAERHYLDGRAVPASVVAALDGAARTAVVVARPPVAAVEGAA